MCLICSRNAKIRRANKALICYKVLRKDGEYLRAPYFETTYEIGSVVSSNKPLRLLNLGKDDYLRLDTDEKRIEEGLHTYKNVFDAMMQMAELNLVYGVLYVVAECKIPIGARYVEGRMLFSEKKTYVSDKLIVEKLI